MTLKVMRTRLQQSTKPFRTEESVIKNELSKTCEISYHQKQCLTTLPPRLIKCELLDQATTRVSLSSTEAVDCVACFAKVHRANENVPS